MANPFAAAGSNPFAAAAAPAAANPFAATTPATSNPFAAAPAPAAANPFATAPAAANPFAAASAAPAAANPFATVTAAAPAAANPFAVTTTAAPVASNPFAAANPFATAAPGAANPFAVATVPGQTGLGQVNLGAVNTVTHEINYDTPFNKLPPAMQAVFNDLNTRIHETDNYQKVLKRHSTVPLKELKATLVEVRQSVSALRNSLQQKNNAIQTVQRRVERDQHHADMAHLIVRDFASGFAREVQLPSAFFWQLLAQFEERMERHAKQIALLEQILLPHRTRPVLRGYMSGYEDDAMASAGAGGGAGAGDGSYGEVGPDGRPRLTPQMLTRLLVAQNEAFTVLAGGKVANLHAEVERLKEQYLRIVNDYADAARGGGARSQALREDPFRDQDRVEAEAHQRAEDSRRIEVPQSMRPAAPATATAAPAAGATAANPFAVATTATGVNAANPFGTIASPPTTSTRSTRRKTRRW